MSAAAKRFRKNLDRERREAIPLYIERRTLDLLRSHARGRGVTTVDLATMVLDAVARDNLVQAVLDDGARLEAAE